MKNQNNVHIQFDYEAFVTYVPERGLLSAVLERAYRDLDDSIDVDDEDKRSAIKWILSNKQEIPNGFSFIEVVSILELSDGQINHIRRKARKLQCQRDGTTSE